MNSATTKATSVPYINIWAGEKAAELGRDGRTSAVVDRDGRIVARGPLTACYWQARYDVDLRSTSLGWALLGHAKLDGMAAALAAATAAPAAKNPYALARPCNPKGGRRPALTQRPTKAPMNPYPWLKHIEPIPTNTSQLQHLLSDVTGILFRASERQFDRQTLTTVARQLFAALQHDGGPEAARSWVAVWLEVARLAAVTKQKEPLRKVLLAVEAGARFAREGANSRREVARHLASGVVAMLVATIELEGQAGEP